jgi:acyl phosphate:glycerol-3-phosphate acyltransferase
MVTSENAISLAAVFLVVYLIGAVNLSFLAARVAGIDDMRRIGSGNPGVTNLYRAAGLRVALPVLIGDILKAVMAVNLVLVIGQPSLRPLTILPYMFGNLFPLFHGFKGGKGVAAAVGAVLAQNPLVMLLGGGVFIILFALFRRVSIGSLSMGFSYPLWVLLLDESLLFFWVSCAVAIILVLTHRRNITRILKGTEPRLEREGR